MIESLNATYLFFRVNSDKITQQNIYIHLTGLYKLQYITTLRMKNQRIRAPLSISSCLKD